MPEALQDITYAQLAQDLNTYFRNSCDKSSLVWCNKEEVQAFFMGDVAEAGREITNAYIQYCDLMFLYVRIQYKERNEDEVKELQFSIDVVGNQRIWWESWVNVVHSIPQLNKWYPMRL